MQSLVTFLLAIAILCPIACLAQKPDADPCGGMPAQKDAATGFLRFDRFDRELRASLAKQDAVALAFLVKFPLRVNEAAGSISINNAAALKRHFNEVFTPAVRKAILERKSADFICNVEGIGYPDGVIWVDASDRGYAIFAVNRDAVPPYPAKHENDVTEYACQTQTHRLVVDTVAGEFRYRSWNKPRSVMDLPDLQIGKGKETSEGHDLCVIPIYTFRNGGVEYKVEAGTACDSQAPKDATGDLVVTIKGKPPTTTWCY